MEWLIEIVLIGLLAATLVHAIRLERALGVLKRDRAALDGLVNGFNESTRQAEAGIERLRAAADGAGRQIARQIESATALRDDLGFLTERGERLADRIDALVRAGRPVGDAARSADALLGRDASRAGGGEGGRFAPDAFAPAAAEPGEPGRVRSQAERDLLKALRMAR